jgi:hypothetical protein
MRKIPQLCLFLFCTGLLCGLPSNAVACIVADSAGRLCMSTPTWWLRGGAIAIALMLIAASHLYRVRAIRRQFEVRLEERVAERTRIARELHDSLLQGFQGLLFRLQALRNMVPEHSPQLVAALDVALEKGDQAIIKAREAVQDSRASGIEAGDLEAALAALREEFAQPAPSRPAYRVLVEGKPRLCRRWYATTCIRLHGKHSGTPAGTPERGISKQKSITAKPSLRFAFAMTAPVSRLRSSIVAGGRDNLVCRVCAKGVSAPEAH